MIIANIFSNLFKDLTLTYRDFRSDLVSSTVVTKDVHFHFGDSKELAKWIRGRSGKEKYPLIWYQINEVKNNNGDFIENDCTLIFFTSTKQDYYNNTRSLINYTNILEPLSSKVFDLIDSNGYIQTIFNDPNALYKSFDVPNYGVDEDGLDMTRNEKKGTKGITIDILDARRIEFQARFNKKCLIK
jgi:hypothetical protein